MNTFKSNITKIISKVKDSSLEVLALEVEAGLHNFLEVKLKEQGRILSKEEQLEIARKKQMIAGSENLIEFDRALFNFEGYIGHLLNLKPGELEFAISRHLQEVSEVVGEFAKVIFDEMKEAGEAEGEYETEKKEGRVLPFKNENGKLK